jgi:hypothetical protein
LWKRKDRINNEFAGVREWKEELLIRINKLVTKKGSSFCRQVRYFPVYKETGIE